MSPSLPLVVKTFTSHCLVTVTTGTNYAARLDRHAVKTHFALRFDQALPLQIKGLKEAGQFVGFELSLTGHDEMEQLVLALESAAASLREEAGKAAEQELAAETSRRAQAWEAQQQGDACERGVLRLLVLYGAHVLPTGISVGHHLYQALREQPPVWADCAGLWELSRAAFPAAGPVAQGWANGAWLTGRGTDAGQALVAGLLAGKRDYARAEKISVRAGFKREDEQLPRACAHALFRLELARSRVASAALVAQIAQRQELAGGQEPGGLIEGLLNCLSERGRRERELATALGQQSRA